VRVLVIGVGVVGGAVVRQLTARGKRVIAVDHDPHRVHELTSAGVDAVSDVPELCDGDVVMLCVPTPESEVGYDLSALVAACREVGNRMGRLEGSVTIAQRSTVMPGTLESVLIPLIEHTTGLVHGQGFHAAANPEFLRALHADHDFANPRVTVIGSQSPHARDVLRELDEHLGGEIVETENPSTAELAKCAHNAFNATKISFWNQMWLLGTRVGVDMDIVSSVVSRSSEASTNALYGIEGGRPYAGACLPKDVRALASHSESLGVDMALLKAVVEVNRLIVREAGDEGSATL